MAAVTYGYDSGTNGKGQRTSMTDGSGSAAYSYDTRGRQTQEIKTIDSTPYTTSYTYDGADRAVTTTYPTLEVVRQNYNGRGLPSTLGSDALPGNNTTNLVTGTLYNFLGQMTELNLGNSVKTSFGYYGTGGTYDTTGGYYGKPWETKSTGGGSQSYPLTGWANRVQITIDHTKVTSDLTQFPVLIKISNSSGTTATDLTAIFTALGSNSKKIAVTQADGTTQLNVEVEKWDSANQQAWLWVSKSGWSISSTQDTTLYLYYDNTHADNTAYVGDTNSTPARAVWDANYKAVYHLNDGADTSHIYDSTSNANNGTKKAANEPVQADGLSGKAQQFDGTNDYTDTGAGTASITGDLTLEAFFKPTTSSASEARALIDTRQSRNDYTLPYELALGSSDNEPYIRFGEGSACILVGPIVSPLLMNSPISMVQYQERP